MCGRDHCVPHTGQQHSEAPSRLHFTAEKTDSRRVKRSLNVTKRTNGAGLCPVGVTPVLPSTMQATLLSQEGVSEVTEARAPLLPCHHLHWPSLSDPGTRHSSSTVDIGHGLRPPSSTLLSVGGKFSPRGHWATPKTVSVAVTGGAAPGI